MTHATDCRFCTVPTEGDDVCSFCKTYRPPTPDNDLSRLAAAVEEVAVAVADATSRIPTDAPLWSVVDATAATAHLRAAARLLDRAAHR